MLEQKIVSIKKRMSNLDQSSMAYQTYADVLRSLEKEKLGNLRIHNDPNDAICESCQ